MKRTGRRLLLRTLGREVRCEVCGAPLFTGVPIVWRGQVRLIGAERADVRVDFCSMTRLAFAHAVPGECGRDAP